MIEGEIDIEYALGELQTLQTEMEQYFGKDGSLRPERIEGLEARLKEQGESIDRLTAAIEALIGGVAHSPYMAVTRAAIELHGR